MEELGLFLESADSGCGVCGARVSKEQRDDVLEFYRKRPTGKPLDSSARFDAKAQMEDGCPDDWLRVCEVSRIWCWRSISVQIGERVLHPLNLDLMRAREVALELCLRNCKWDAALSHANHIVRTYAKVYPPSSPLVMHPLLPCHATLTLSLSSTAYNWQLWQSWSNISATWSCRTSTSKQPFAPCGYPTAVITLWSSRSLSPSPSQLAN